MKFCGVNITYRLLPPNVSCYAVGILQAREEKYGSLYVNDSSVLHRPECKEIQYPVIAMDKQSKKHAKTQLTIVLEGTRKGLVCGLKFLLFLFLLIKYNFSDLE